MSRTTKRLAALGAGVALIASVGVALLTPTEEAEGKSSSRARAARAVLVNADGDRVGAVRLQQRRGAVLVSARIVDATPGFHGFHIHETGECDAEAPDGPFTTAGGHYTGGDATHGEHAGDLPSLLVMDDGTARLSFATDAFRLRDLFDADGSAVMVHAGADNFANIPDRYVSSESGQPGPDATTRATGDAGARYACGVVRK
ncbi:MAG: superoxide dismutase family protein [Actinomycetota bacterium]